MPKTIDSLKILNTTQSTSVDTGSLIVSGGVGIAGNLTVGGEIARPIRNVTTDTTLDSDYILNVNNPVNVSVRLPDITDPTYDGVEYIVIKQHDAVNEFLATETQTLTASDAIGNENFGSSCAIYYNTMIVGSNTDDLTGTNDGSAFIFVRSGTTWTEQAKLTASDKFSGDQLGYSCSIYGDTAIAGAWGDDIGNSDNGSVYVYTRSGTTWTEIQKLTASDSLNADFFGRSCAIYKDTIVTGAILVNHSGFSDAGSAYVFTRSGTTWSEIQKLTASDKGDDDYFGQSCSIYKDTIVIGANGDNVPTNNEGSVYIFTLSGGTWTETQKLTASDSEVSDNFGRSCSIHEDTVVIGAYLDDLDATRTDAGSAYIFTRTGTTWSLQQKLTASDGLIYSDNDGYLGYSCSIYGDTVVVGARVRDIDGDADQGCAYVYTRSGTEWTEVQKMTKEDSLVGGINVGYSCALYENTFVLGSVWSYQAGLGAGAGYIFDIIQPSGPNVVSILAEIKEVQKLTATDAVSGDYMGVAQSSMHMDSLVVSSYWADTGGLTDAGAAWVFAKSGDTWVYEAKLTASDKEAGDFFGSSCSIYGDTAVVGTSQDDVPTFWGGSAYVFTRSGASWTEIQKLTASDKGSSDQFGISCAIYGDAIAVGAHRTDDSGTGDNGRIYIFTKSGTTWTETQQLNASDKGNDDNFGYTCAMHENTLVVGTRWDNIPTNNEGSAYIFTRSGTTWTEQAKLTAGDGNINDQFGQYCSIHGDTVVVSSYSIDVVGVDEGAAYIFTRSGTTWTQEAKLTTRDKADSDYVGYSCSIYEDTVVIGSHGDDVVPSDSGSAYVYERSGTTWNEIKKITASDKADIDYFGISCAIYGDTIAVFATGEDEAGGDAGSGYIFDIQRITGTPDVSRVALNNKDDYAVLVSDSEKWNLM